MVAPVGTHSLHRQAIEVTGWTDTTRETDGCQIGVSVGCSGISHRKVRNSVLHCPPFLPLARPSSQFPGLGRTSFSLAEVKTEEPVMPGGQPQGHVATLLMFEWTLRIKQESEGPKV